MGLGDTAHSLQLKAPRLSTFGAPTQRAPCTHAPSSHLHGHCVFDHHSAGGLHSGDQLLLLAGDSWTATAPVHIRGWGSGAPDGTAGPPAIVGAYSADPNTPLHNQHRPWVRRTAASGVGPVLSFTNCAGLEIVGLELSGGEQGVLFSYEYPSSMWGGLVCCPWTLNAQSSPHVVVVFVCEVS